MYTISKSFSFDAAHQLHGLPKDHKCSRLHGHTYTVEVYLQAEALDKHGFVVDYNELGLLKKYIDERLDHRNLNEVINTATTAENIARHLYDLCKSWWPEVVAVTVSETPKTKATYSPSGRF